MLHPEMVFSEGLIYMSLLLSWTSLIQSLGALFSSWCFNQTNSVNFIDNNDLIVAMLIVIQMEFPKCVNSKALEKNTIISEDRWLPHVLINCFEFVAGERQWLWPFDESWEWSWHRCWWCCSNSNSMELKQRFACLKSAPIYTITHADPKLSECHDVGREDPPYLSEIKVKALHNQLVRQFIFAYVLVCIFI